MHYNNKNVKKFYDQNITDSDTKLTNSYHILFKRNTIASAYLKLF